MKNPLTMIGTLDRCWLFVYQTPLAAARALLPSALTPISYRGYAFWNVVVSHIQAMRPWPLPAAFGLSYWHVAYRLYASFTPRGGAPIEGLYFLRSDCDDALIGAAGNLLTDFHFHRASIAVKHEPDCVAIEVASPDAPAQARLNNRAPVRLPEYSPFDSIERAAEFLKYKPNGISIGAHNANIVHIKRRESDWRARLVEVESARWQYFEHQDVRFEICYQVEPIFYCWQRGRNYPAAEGEL